MGSRRRLTVGLLMCIVAIAFESMAVLTAMPAAVEDLGELDLYAWAFTAFVIGQTFSIVASGQLCDRLGPVKPLVVGFSVFTVGLVIAGVAPTMMVLLIARLIQGLGAGTMNVAVMVLVARVFDPHERAQLMTWFSACWMLPAFVGPPIAAWITSALSWHWVFWALLPVLLIAGLLVLGPLGHVRLLGEPDDAPTHRHLFLAGLVSVGAVGLQAAGQRIEPLSAVLALGALAALGFGLPPLMPAGFRWIGRGISAVVGVRLLSAGAFFGAQAFVPLMLIQTRGLSLFWAGTTLTVGSIGWMAGSWVQARPWFGMRRDTMIGLGAALVSAGIAVVGVTAAIPSTWLGLAALGWVLAGLGMGLQMASSNLTVMQESPATELGRNTSALQVGEALGSSIMAGIAGTWFVLFHATGPLPLTFGGLLFLMAGLGVLAVGLSLRIGPVQNHSAGR